MESSRADAPPRAGVAAGPGGRGWVLAGALVLLVSAAPLVRYYLVRQPPEIWQVDLEVYRDGSVSVLLGRDVYAWLTGSPQWLPFTYPPFATLLGMPLALVPFRVAGWAWTGLQLWLLWVCTGVAFRPFLDRFGRRAPLLQGVVAGLLVWSLPVAEGIRFGQVNAVIVTLCLVDVARRTPRTWPRGVLVGVATAVKLTPGVFWVHWAVSRRWRPLAVSVATTAAVTGLTLLLLPAASATFWTDALLDPGRLGPNAGTSNQSLRGVLLRLWPGGSSVAGPGPGFTPVWVAVALVVGVLGFAAARGLERRGERVAVVAVVGMLAVLLSPVSWVHHVHWGIVVVGALLGDGRRPARVVAAVVALGMLLCRLPWWGVTVLADGDLPRWFGRLLQNGYAVFALLAVAALWWLLVRRPDDAQAPPVGSPVPQEAAGAVR
ncbi:glycosyltransferase 87 family protein [Kineosporia sp. A_224]|uniref:glycosyltransferase 87 family protein n=1 Tax=Kineosporia sp. A_224 TaxID=1962180 RepID=UPI000B4B756E|nr:glycosyltransferase 87 family protein [Kineosporia sp. A_224]